MRIQVMEQLDGPLRRQWVEFLARAAHTHPEQHPRFSESWNALGHDVLFALGWDRGELCAVALFDMPPRSGFAGRFPTATAVSGPVCDSPDCMRAFLDALARHEAFAHVRKLKVTPYWLGSDASQLAHSLAQSGWTPFEEDYQRTTGIHDATGQPDDIASRFNKTARRKLRRALEAGLEIEYVSDDAVAGEVFAICNRHFEARFGDRLDPQVFMADFRNVYATGDLGALFVLRHEGAIVAGCMVHRSHDTVFFRHSFIDDTAAERLGRIRVAPLITFEALRWGNERGCRFADENGYIEGLDESHPLYRVYKYKEEFRPTQVQRFPGHEKVLRPAVTRAFALADWAHTGARHLARALHPRTRTRRAGGVPGAPAAAHIAAPATAPDRSFAQRMLRKKVPIGLTIGGTTGLFLTLLAD